MRQSAGQDVRPAGGEGFGGLETLGMGGVAERIAVALITWRELGAIDDVGREPDPRPAIRGPETTATPRTAKQAMGRASLSAKRPTERSPRARTGTILTSGGAGLQVLSISAVWACIRSRRRNSKSSALIGRVPPVFF
jgi:hypothetical protein